MADQIYSLSTPDLIRFAARWKDVAPAQLLEATNAVMFNIGSVDNRTMTLSVGSSLDVKSKAFLNSFKFKAAKAKTIEEAQVSEYTGAKPMRIFQTGGTVIPVRSKFMTILTDEARSPSGRRKFTQKQFRQMLQTGVAKVIRTGRGLAIIRDFGGFTKSGKAKKGTRTIILAFLRKRITQKKRIDFFANHEKNVGTHEKSMNDMLTKKIAEIIKQT